MVLFGEHQEGNKMDLCRTELWFLYFPKAKAKPRRSKNKYLPALYHRVKRRYLSIQNLTAGTALFAMATSQSPGLPEPLATAYNFGMCLLALPVMVL